MQPDPILELRKWAQLAGVWGQPTIRRAIEVVSLMTDPKTRETRIAKLLKNLSMMALARVAEDHPFLPYPEAEELGEPQSGDVVPGFVDTMANGPPIHVRLAHETLAVHMLVAGPTGKGKSMFVFNIVRQLIGQGIPIWIFDTQGEYADLLPALLPFVTVVRFRDFRRNPFHGPPNITQGEWLLHMSNYLREAFFYRDGVINLFREVSKRVLEKAQDLNTQTFSAEFLKTPQKARRLMDYFESLKRFVSALEMGPYSCASGFDLVSLSGRPVVFDLSSVSSDLRLFFVADLLTWQDAWRGYQRSRGLEMVIVLDEMSRFFSREAAARSDLGEPFILQMLKTSRKKGIGLILADQTYTQFHEVVRSNCQNKVIFETMDGPSRLDIARDLGLDQEQQLFLSEMSFGSPNRRVVVQIPTYPRPFLMTIPAIETPADSTPYRPPELDWTPLPELEPKPKKKDRDEVTHEMEKYLGVIANNPFRMETEYDLLMQQSGAHSRTKGTRLRQELKEAGLLEEHKINTYKRGPGIKIAMPTKAGYELLDRKRIKYRVPEGNGGIAHKFWQHTIARKLQKQGWQTQIEQILKQKQVDVGFTKGGPDGEKVAYEIVIEDLQKELSNLEKDLADGWDRVVFCVDYEETRERLSTLLPEVEDRVEIRLLKEFT